MMIRKDSNLNGKYYYLKTKFWRNIQQFHRKRNDIYSIDPINAFLSARKKTRHLLFFIISLCIRLKKLKTSSILNNKILECNLNEITKTRWNFFAFSWHIYVITFSIKVWWYFDELLRREMNNQWTTYV
jgi:hypothetical protein